MARRRSQAVAAGRFCGKIAQFKEFIPERTTDFIFAAFGEEFGLLGNLLLIATFLFLVLRALTIALEAPIVLELFLKKEKMLPM